MIKDLRIIFKPEEKTIENLNKVLEILGDESWDDMYKHNVLFSYNNSLGIRYGAGEYVYLTADSVDGTELTLTEFFEKYDKEIITDFTNTYCDASELHYKKLNTLDLEVAPNFRYALQHDAYFYSDNGMMMAWGHKNCIGKMFDHEYWSSRNKIYFNTDINKWVYVKETPTYEDTLAEGIPKKHIKQVCNGEWNGYYIPTSKEAYDLFIADGYTPLGKRTYLYDDYDFYIISNSKICGSFKEKLQDEKPLYIVDGKLSATQYHPDEVSFSASDTFCRKEVSDSDDLAMGDKRYIERENFIVRVSSIFGIHYHNGSANFRMKNGYINNLQMSKKEFLELKREFKRKSN